MRKAEGNSENIFDGKFWRWFWEWTLDTLVGIIPLSIIIHAVYILSIQSSIIPYSVYSLSSVYRTSRPENPSYWTTLPGLRSRIGLTHNWLELASPAFTRTYILVWHLELLQNLNITRKAISLFYIQFDWRLCLFLLADLYYWDIRTLSHL